MNPFRLAVLSLTRRKAPTVITALSIAISVACAGMLLRLYHLSASRFDSMAQGFDAVVGAKAGGIEILLNSLNGEGAYPEFLPYALYESLHAAQAVHFEDGQDSRPTFLKSISPFLYFAKLGDYKFAGTDEAMIAKMNSPLSSYAEGQWPANDDGAVVGSAVARDLHLNVGATIHPRAWFEGVEPTGSEFELKVAGILVPTHSAWDRMIFAPVSRAQAVLADNREGFRARSIWGEHVLNYFLIDLQPGGFEALAALVNKRTVGQAIQVSTEKERLEDLTMAGKRIGLFVSIFVILLSALSVSSMLITRFEGMTAQLAVLRAIGHSRREVGLWLIWEGLLLGLAGCVLGAAIDAAGFPVLRGLLGTALPPPDLIGSSVFESAMVWLLTLVATIAAIFIPLIRLYRQDVHQALKS